MKKLLYLAIILLGVGLLSSCDKLGGNDFIIGEWNCISTTNSKVVERGELWVFRTHGTLTFYKNRPIPATTTYRYDKKEDIFYYGSENYFKVLSHTTSEMEISINGEGLYRFIDHDKE